jgi:8-oxo-dGTP pyrophosphatase MutT (NUDIX family)
MPGNEHENITLLNREPRDLKFANMRPFDAATLIVLDNKGPTSRVLMGKRNDKLKFMPGMFVFPGGRAEGDDIKVPVASGLKPEVASPLLARMTRPSVSRAHRIALAAIRETFEETGLVIGVPGAAPPLPNDKVWSDFLATGHLPDLSALRLLARAITPPRRPRRFDTRFFVVGADAIRHSVGTIVGPDAELTELAWLTLEETHTMPLPAITRAVLRDLENALRDETLGKAGHIPFYMMKNRRFLRETL